MSKGFKHFVVADDQGIVRYGMSCLIKELYPWAEIVTTDSFQEIYRVVKEIQIDLLIMDGKILDNAENDLLAVLRSQQKNLKVLIFSGRNEKFNALRYLKAGANGFLTKQAKEQEIKLAVDTIVNDRRYMSQALKENLIQDLVESSHKNPFDSLSEREFSVSQLLVSGHGIGYIAAHLNLKVSTVGTYKSRLYEKLNVDNLVHLTEKYWMWNDQINHFDAKSM